MTSERRNKLLGLQLRYYSDSGVFCFVIMPCFRWIPLFRREMRPSSSYFRLWRWKRKLHSKRSYSPTILYCVTNQETPIYLDHEDSSSNFIRNIHIHVQYYTVSQTRRPHTVFDILPFTLFVDVLVKVPSK